jgi:hypothetical protein
MSNATWTAVVLAALACGCATGTNANGTNVDAAVTPHHDDASHVTADAPGGKMDAGVVLDAPAQMDAPADAASALFCTDNSMCTNSGECCITLGGPQGFCGTGVIVLGACVPQ